MLTRKIISLIPVLFVAVIGQASEHKASGLDIPLSIGADPGVAGAITTADDGLSNEDGFYFGEAVNALREEFRCYGGEEFTDAEIKRSEMSLLDGMTPRQIILAGLALYRRQNHSPEAGKGKYQHWGPKDRMPDSRIDEALKRYAKKL